MSSIEVSLNHVPVINFSMQQNHVAVVREVIVGNRGEDDIADVDVVICFDPEFADAVTLHIDRIAAGGEARLTDMPVHISTTYLSNLTERISGTVRAEVRKGDECLATFKGDIAVLAFDQWGGIAVLPEMLASFVTPNHPDITPVMKRASEILGKWTGSPSLNEYQTRDPNRVKLQMAAIYEAIAELRIAYCTVPASFEDYGQRVRMTTDILSGRLATCLDMTLFYASCLEAAGIHPLLVVVKGHAFAGGWLIADSFPDSVNDDVSLLTKRTADGINEILLVETTCMNDGSVVAFDDAVALANNKLANTDEFLLFVDVLRARHARIRPLPQRVVRDGVFEICEEPAPERDADAPAALSATDIVTDVARIDVDKQTIWERKLLDLSLRNSLLNTRITRNTLQLISADVNELEDVLAAGIELQILPKPTDWDNPLMSEGIYKALTAKDPLIELAKDELTQRRLHSYLGPEALHRTLTTLYRTSRLSLEENGVNTVYLAVGFLKWFETQSSTRPRYAPIILLPIEIVRKSAAKGYVIRSRDEETMINITLLEMLRQDFGIAVSGLDPLPRDESGVDVAKIFNVIRRVIMSKSGWDVEELAVIGNFAFSKFIMWNDIHNNASKLSRNKIVASLISGRREWTDGDVDSVADDLDKAYPAGKVALPIGADSSQFEAICAAVDEKSFILHGPPGTGKSQTITNIIANALYNGKKVLFVAEKMAALQVVQRRLESIGLAPFCLELHSNKAKKSTVLEQLKRTTEVVKRRSDEAFAIKAEQINALRSELNGYVESLHRVYPAGLSLYDCFSRYAGVGYEGDATAFQRQIMAAATPSSLAVAEEAVAEYMAMARLCDTPSACALDGIGLTEYQATVKAEARDLLSRLIKAIDRYRSSEGKVSSLLKYDLNGLSADRQAALDSLLNILLSAPDLPAGLLIQKGDTGVYDLIAKAVATGRERDKAREAILRDFNDRILTWSFGEWEEKWNQSSRKWWLFRILGQNKVKSALKPFVSSGNALTEQVISDLFPLLDTYTRLQREIDGLDSRLSTLLGRLWDKDHAEWSRIEEACLNVRATEKQIMMLTRDIAAASELKDTIARNLECGLDTFRQIHAADIRSLAEAAKDVTDLTAAAARLLKADSLSAATPDERRAMAARWTEGIESLRDKAACNHCREHIISLGFRELVDAVETGTVAPDDISGCFAKSFYRSYAEYILSCEPAMNSFHGLLFDEKVERFRQFSAEFEQLTRQELFARLAAALPALQKEAAQNSEVGILQRNIRNGGRGTSIRRLFDQIPDLLTRMCPCMLMSPISVAQYIDADRAPFDLVIFDEASQMPTSEAVGAIARGRNVIVVGDPKQMPPTSFFTANTFDEDNADKEDMENILEDCLALSMPSKYLLWHYRSKHESLIAFSNVKYYDNKLLTFPSPDDLTTRIGWQHVDGVYDRGKTRQNRAEAEAVVEEIRRRLSSPATASRSIGVVTFNTNQQSLIEDLLNELFSAHPELETVAMECEEPIFVKNLENVQGDERDVILFSIGYGPDKDGRIALNFGPLNRDGGRRRLNVAVSRARYEMKVFSTLRAEQIDLNRTSAEGVADLKAFLEYAEKGRDYLPADPSSAGDANADSLTASIASELRDRGYDVRTDVGCSGYKIDLGVVDDRDPDKYLLGILCDGYNFRSARTANDRVVTQSTMLGLLGWRIHRVWSMDWWENRAKVIEGIISAIENARNEPEPDPEPDPEPFATDLIDDTPADDCDPATLASAPTLTAVQPEADDCDGDADSDPSRVPYRETALYQETASAEDFVSGRLDSRILNKISAVIATEAPVSKTLLCRRVINSFGISRMGARISLYMDRLLGRAALVHTGRDATFYWNSADDPERLNVYRPVSDREALDIAPEEIAVAIVRILEDQGSLPPDDLRLETARAFNYARRGDNVIAAIDRAVSYAESRHRIVVTADRVRLA